LWRDLQILDVKKMENQEYYQKVLNYEDDAEISAEN